MSAKTKYFKLGAFVLAGTAVAVGAVVILGAGTIMRKKVMVETYMDESVQGLGSGRPSSSAASAWGGSRDRVRRDQYKVQDDPDRARDRVLPRDAQGIRGGKSIAT
jgi:hypothetical protein